MNRLHQTLTQKYPKYNNWHQTKHHNKIHWGVLVVFTLLVFGIISRWTPISLAADTTAPTTPTNLTATVISSSQINLSWTASTDDTGVTGYNIYRCAGSGCAPTVQIATSATNSYSNTGLTASTAYTYAVSAYDAAGNESVQSTQTSATTQAQTSNCSQSNILCVDVIAGPTQEYSTIQAAVNAAATGDTILVHAGTYTDSSVISTNTGAAWLPADATKTANIVIKTAGTAALPITIKSAGGAVIVDGQSNVAFNLYGVSRPYYIIDGITFRNATETSVFSKGSNGHNFTVKNSTFEGNSSGPTDRGLNLQGADNIVINNTFTYTNSTFGAIDQNYGTNIIISQNIITGSHYGIYLHRGSDNSIIEKNVLTGNSSCTDCTAILYRESNGVIIRYNLIKGNWSNNNITYQNTLLSNYPAYGNNNKILNNTIHCGNRTTGINQDPDGRIFVETTNNIISNCSTGIDGIDPNLLPAGQPGYNIIHGATYKYYWSGNPNKDSWPVGTANIVTDPLFVTPGIDYKLQAGSPAVDAGDPNTPLGTDFSGTIIPQGLRADIGAFEYISTDTTPPTTPTNLTVTAVSSSQINLSWIASTDDVGVAGYKIYRCAGFGCTPTVQIATSAANPYSDTGLTASTVYTYTVSAYDVAGNNSGQSTQAQGTTQASTPGSFIPAPTSAVGRGLHPRLYFSKDDIPTLELRTRTTHATQYNYLKQHADQANKTPIGDYQMGEGRSRIPVFAFVALMEKEKGNPYSTYVNAAKNYAQLNLNSGYGTYDFYLPGNIIHNLAIVYDWLYDELTPTERQQYIDKIIDAMSYWNDMTVTYDRSLYHPGFPKYRGQLSTGALAFYGDGYRQSDAQIYVDIAEKNINNFVVAGNDAAIDGGWFDGFAYVDDFWAGWASSLGHFIGIFKAYKTATEINKFTDSDFLRNFSLYVQYSIRPKDGTLQRSDEWGSYFSPPTHIYPNHYRVWASLLADEYYKLGDTDVAGRYQWLAQRETPYNSYIPSLQNRKALWDIIWYNPDITPIPPDNALLSTRVFMDNGFVIMRDGFGSPNDFFATFSNRDYYEGHQHNDNNSFTIEYNGAGLAIESGYYDGFSGVNSQGYYHRTTAHNSILVVDPNKWNGTTFFDQREGGQYSRRGSRVLSEVGTEGTKHDIASMKTDITSNYDYIWGDATDAYKAIPGLYTPKAFENYNQLNNFTRQFVRLKPNNYIVIFDRVSSKDPSFQKKWPLHTLEEPEINGSVVDTEVPGNILSYNGDTVKITKDKGRLFHKVLLPDSYKIRKVGGSGYEFWRDDSKQNYAPNPTRINPARPLDPPIDGWEMGKWRYEIWPTVPQNDDLFLNVLDPTNSTTTTMVSTQRINASSGNMVGALIQDPTNPHVVMFSKTESPQSSVTYDANYSSSLTGKHLLADITPGTYDIYKNGAKIFTGIVSQPDKNTLSFESTGGSVFQIVKTGEVPPPTDTTAPTTPTNFTASAIFSSQINLSWTTSTDDTGVVGYKIYRCAGSACAPTTQIATSATNSYSSTGLTASTAYTYAVSAYDAAGNESGKSSTMLATTLSQFKQADFNKDGIVNQLDFDILKQDWNRTDKPVSDINQDGIVDSRDLGIMMSEWSR